MSTPVLQPGDIYWLDNTKGFFFNFYSVRYLVGDVIDHFPVFKPSYTGYGEKIGIRWCGRIIHYDTYRDGYVFATA